MARINRYRKLEDLMTKVLLGDTALLVLYLVFSGMGWGVVRIIVAVLAVVVSLFSIFWLYLTNELFKRRSLWMVTGAAAILLVLIVSLILNYPAPAVQAASTVSNVAK